MSLQGGLAMPDRLSFQWLQQPSYCDSHTHWLFHRALNRCMNLRALAFSCSELADLLQSSRGGKVASDQTRLCRPCKTKRSEHRQTRR